MLLAYSRPCCRADSLSRSGPDGLPHQVADDLVEVVPGVGYEIILFGWS